MVCVLKRGGGGVRRYQDDKASAGRGVCAQSFLAGHPRAGTMMCHAALGCVCAPDLCLVPLRCASCVRWRLAVR